MTPIVRDIDRRTRAIVPMTDLVQLRDSGQRHSGHEAAGIRVDLHRHPIITAMFALSFILVNSGCTSTTTAVAIVPPEPVRETTLPGPNREIDQLLTAAEQALQRKRLTTPAEDNAYLRYLQILSRDPDNREAIAGIARIVETYLSWAALALERDQYARAESMLNKANSVDDQHPAIEVFRERLLDLQSQERSIIKISQSDLTNRSAQLSSQLRQIAENYAGQCSIIKIRAQTDADARWIYQQMNLGTESRLRATIQSGHPPSVQLSYP